MPIFHALEAFSPAARAPGGWAVALHGEGETAAAELDGGGSGSHSGRRRQHASRGSPHALARTFWEEARPRFNRGECR